MAVIRNEIRWADNTAELKANILSGVGTIDAMKAAVDRTVTSLGGQGLFKAANNVTAAIKEMGGVTKLTAAEQDRVNTLLEKAIEKYKVMGMTAPPMMVDLANATKKVTVEAIESTTVLSSMAARLAGMFTIGALIAFGREVLNAGDRIQKMADQTALSTGEVQKLDYIAGQSGTSIESLVGAVQNLQVRLGDENSGAAGAMAKLGINADAFNKLGTYEQMTTLGEAIKNVHDPTEQASLAAAIFGKTWKEIMPAIKSGMKELGEEAPMMADSTVKSLDRIGDALTRSKQMMVAWSSTVVLAIEQAGFEVGDYLSEYDPQHWGVANSEILKHQVALQNQLLPSVAALKAPILAVNEGFKAHTLTAAEARSAEEKLAASMKTLTAAQLANIAAWKEYNASADGFGVAVTKMNAATVEGIKYDLERGKSVKMLAEVYEVTENQVQAVLDQMKFEQSVVAATGTKWKAFGTTVQDFSLIAKEAAEHVLPQLDSRTQNYGLVTLPTTESSLKRVEQGFDNVGLVLDVLGDALGRSNNKWAQMGAIAIQTFQAVSNALAKGDIFGAVVAGVTGAIAALKKLFTSAEKEVNPIREAFVQLHGGLRTLGEEARIAGTNLTAMLNAKNPEAYKKAIEDLNAAFKFQDDAMKTLDETAQKYGFTLQEMPERFRQGKLNEQFLELYQDQKVLTAGGFDFDTILQKQVGTFQELINVSMETGATIPAQLQPAIARLIEMGLVTDSTGAKLTDVGQLTFAETLEQKFSTLIDTINKLADAISRGIGGAVAAIPDVKTIHVGYTYEPYNPPDSGDAGNYASKGGLVTNHGIQYLGMGGNVLPFAPRGSDTVPAMLTPGERVLSVEQNRALSALTRGGRSSGGSSVDMAEFRAMRIAAEATAKTMAEMHRAAQRAAVEADQRIARAVRDAVQTAPGRRR